MPSYDGEVRINTNIDTKEAQHKLMSLQNHMDKTARKVESVTKKMDELKDAKVEDTSKWKKLRGDIDSTKEQIQSLTAKAREMRNIEVPTEEYLGLQYQLKEAQKECDKLYAKADKMRAEGKATGEAWRALKERFSTAEAKAGEIYHQMVVLKKEGNAFTSQTGTDAYKQVKADLQAAYGEMRRLKGEEKELEAAFNSDKTAGIDKLTGDLREANADIELTKLKMEQVINKQKDINFNGFDKFGQSARKASDSVKRLAKESNSANKGFSNLVRTMKQMVLSMAVFQIMSKGIEALKSGLQNLAVYSADYNKSMSELISSTSQLKNAFAVAFQPILNVVIPILTRLIDYISAAANAVSRFLAILGGKSTYTKAIKQNKDYAASLDKVGGSADKAKGSLAGYDELEVMQKNDSSSGGGGDSGADGSGFIEETVGDTTKFEQIKRILGEIADIFKSGFMEGLGDWESRVADIQEKTQMIKEALLDIFTDPQVVGGAQEFGEAIVYNLGVVAGSVYSMGLTIAENLIGGLAYYLTENTDRIKEHLIKMFDIGTDIANLIGDFAESFAYVFEAFGSENGQRLTGNLIGMFTDAFMGVQELCASWGRDILDVIIQPFVDNKEAFRQALEGLLGTAATVFGTLKDTIDNTFDKLLEVYDEKISPYLHSIADGISDLVGKFLDFWNTDVQPVMDSLAQKFDEVMGEHIQPMLDKACELLGVVAENLQYLWETVLQPLFSWIIENVLPVLLPIIEGLLEAILDFVGFVADGITLLLDILGGLIEFIAGIFTGDWKNAWEGIKSIFSSIWNAIRDFLKKALDGLLSNIKNVLKMIGMNWDGSWQGMKTAVINIWNGIWSGIKNVINKIIGGIENMVNAVANGLNKLIGGLNSVIALGSEVSTLVFGAAIPSIPMFPSVSIPRLANGGITTGSTLANIGEAGREAVLPLERNTGWMDTLAERINGSGSQSINLTVELDGDTVYKRMVELDREFAGRTGSSRFSYGY